MNLTKRLDIIEAALNLDADSEPCTVCGAPWRGDRRNIAHLFVGDQLGTCEACGRHLDMKREGLPILGGKVIGLVRSIRPSEPSEFPCHRES